MRRTISALLFAVLMVGPPVSSAFGWVTEVVDRSVSGGNGGEGSSIAVGPTGAVHIASINESFGCLQYTTNASGHWKTIPLDEYPFEGTTTSIAVDSRSRVTIAYKTMDGLKVATNASGRWETWVACDDPGSGLDGSIAVGPSGKVFICHYAPASLLLTSGIPPASSGWRPASTVAGQSRGASSVPNCLLFLAVPAGILLTLRRMRRRPGG